MKTVMIMDSDEVMAPFGEAGYFIRGKRQSVRITRVGSDEDTPLVVRQALVGKVVYPIFTREQIVRQGGSGFESILPEGCLLCYAQEVINLLIISNEIPAAEALQRVCDNAMDMYILEQGVFEPVS